MLSKIFSARARARLRGGMWERRIWRRFSACTNGCARGTKELHSIPSKPLRTPAGDNVRTIGKWQHLRRARGRARAHRRSWTACFVVVPAMAPGVSQYGAHSAAAGQDFGRAGSKLVFPPQRPGREPLAPVRFAPAGTGSRTPALKTASSSYRCGKLKKGMFVHSF